MRRFFFSFFIGIIFSLFLSSFTSAVYPGILAYGSEGTTTPLYRVWDGTSFGPPLNSTSVGGIVEWLRVASSPVRDEHIILTADTEDDVNVIINSSFLGVPCWHNGTACNSSFELTSSSTAINRLKADVAYEQLSGDALVVYSDNSSIPKYRVWNGSSWTIQQSVPQTLIGGGVVSYVKLASNPLNDEVALIMTNTTALTAFVWNGTNWTCEPPDLLGNALTPEVYQHADLAYEQLSGDLFIVASINGPTEINYTVKPSGSCTYTTSQTTTLSEESEEIVLNPRIGSDYIMIGQRDITGDDMQAIVWNGTTMLATSGNEVSLYAEVSPDILMSTAWAGTSDFGLIVYSDAATSLNLDYMRYNISTNAWAGGATGLNAIGLTNFSDEEQNILAYSFIDENKSFIIVQDDLDDLWAKVFDGNTLTWSDGDGGVALETNHSSSSFPSFDFDWITFRKDSIAPNVTSLIPSSGSLYNQSGTIEVGATVYDNGVLSTVRADILLPNGTVMSLPLSLSSSSKYNASYTIPSLGGRYLVTIFANDSYNNINSSESTSFDVDANFTFISYSSVNRPEGYASGSSHDVFYDGALEGLTLNASLSGTYLSRIFDNGTSFNWGNISWTSGGPYGVPLPNDLASETQWLRGNVNMSGNVLLLHFDESAGTGFNDSSGLGHTITVQDVRYNDSGIFGTGFGFISNASNVSVPVATVLNPRAALTYESWINWKGDANQDFDLQNIITNGDPDRALRVTEPGHFNGGSQVLAYIRVGGSLKQVYSTQQLVPGSWYHLVATYNGTGVGLYINGRFDTSTSASGQVVTGNDNTFIGYEGVVDHFNGTIDEVAIYNRSLNASEILDHYLRGAQRLNFTVRSCDDALCAGEAFVDINDSSPQNLSLAQNRYFQYNVSFSTFNLSYSPELYNVSIGASSLSTDITPPLVSFVTPSESNGSILSRSFVLVNVTASDTDLATLFIRLYNGSGSLLFTNTSATSPLFINYSSLADGRYYFNASANDSAGNVNHTETRTVLIDTTLPLISLVSPLNTTYAVVQTALNYTVSDTNVQVCWYSTNLGVTNTSIACGTNVTGLNSGQGISIWSVYANDSAGNVNSSSVTFFVDSLVPQISFGSGTAANDSTVSRSWVYVNITASDANEQAVTFTLFNASGLVNQSIRSAGTRVINWTSLGDGTYYYNASVNDSLGNLNWTETRTITLDTRGPELTIISPLNSNYTNATILINLSSSDAFAVWFNNGTGNTTYTTGLFQTFGQGTQVLIAYANDSAGNVNQTNVTFFVDSLVPLISFVSPTPANGSASILNWLFVNVSINDSNEHSVVFDLHNRTGLVNRTLASQGTRSFNWTNLADEVYYYNVSVNDTLGTSNWTETRTYTVDSKSPSVYALLPFAGTNVSFASMLEVGANVSDLSSISSVIAFLRYPNGTLVNLSLNLAQGEKYNASLSVPYLPGRYNVSFYVNDSLGNVNSTSTTYFNAIDGTAPLYANATQTPLSPTSYVPFGNYTFNISWSDDVLVDRALLEFNSVNYTMALQGGGVYSVTLSNLAAGNYSYRYLANDSSANWNTTSGASYVITKTSADLGLFLNSTAENLSLVYGNFVNASASSRTNGVQLYRNGINVTSENHQFVGLAGGQYNYTASALENQNYSALNLTRSVIISPASGSVTLLLNGSATNQTASYGVLTNASASSSYGSVTLYRDGVDVTASNHVILQLAAGDYNWTAVSSGNENYSSSSLTLWSHISKLSGNVSLLLNGSADNLTLMYPGQINASARSSTGGVQLYRNGVNVTSENHQFVGLAVGQYNYTAIALESQNYTNVSVVLVATVAGTVPELNISISPSVNVLYPTLTAVTGFGCPTELTCLLYRNNVIVSNPDSGTLGAGSYVYVYNTTGNVNYSSASFSRTLVVNQTSGLVYAYVNHTRANITLELGQSIYLNATLFNGTGEISLFLQNSRINQGLSPLSNLTLFSTAGSFNVTAFYIGNENYSSSYETWFVNVASDASFPTFGSFIEDPVNATLYVSGQAYRFNATIVDNHALGSAGIAFNGVNYSITNVSSVFTFSISDLAAGTYPYYWWANDTGGNYNMSGIRYYTVSPTFGNVTLLLNSIAANLTVPYATPTNVSAVTLYGTTSLFLNGLNISSQNHLNLTRGAGFYNVTALSSGDQNHSSASATFWLNITRISSNVSLYVNHTRANISIVRGTLLPINGSLISGEDGISVWVGSTPIYFGASPSYNVSNFSSVGLVNVTVLYAESQNYTASSETWFVNVTYPEILELTCEVGGPYQANATVVAVGNVSFQGSSLENQLVTLGIYNATGLIASLNSTSASDGGFEGIFGTISVGSYSFNASSSYLGQNATCIDSLQVGGPAQLILDKTASIYSVTNDSIVYTISLRVLNPGASDALLVNITDINSSASPYMLGTLGASAYQNRSYLLNFTRGSQDSFALLSQAFAQGIDSYSGAFLQANSTALNVSVPGFSTGKHVTLVKNIVYLSETSLNVSYNVSTMLYNSGEEDLVNLVYLDTDINPSAFVINLTRADSLIYSSTVILAKAASNQQHTFALATATIDALTFYANQPVVTIPGYGGPADSLVHAPVSVAPAAPFEAVLEVRNMNPDIGQDFQVDYWITSNDESVNFSSGQRTIYVPASGTVNTTVNLVAPSSEGQYRLRALVSWAGGTATAFDSFEVIATGGGSGDSGSGGGGGGSSPASGAVITPHVLPSDEATPDDIVCTSPYIRHGQDCCLDQNDNAICDVDETPAETPRRGFFTGLFTFNLDEILFVRLVDLLLILFISLAVVAFCILVLVRLVRRRKRDSTRLAHLIGMRVYTTHGVNIGTLKEVLVENYRIHSFEISLHHKHHKKAKHVILPYRFVKGVKDVVLIDESVLAHLS